MSGTPTPTPPHLDKQLEESEITDTGHGDGKTIFVPSNKISLSLEDEIEILKSKLIKGKPTFDNVMILISLYQAYEKMKGRKIHGLKVKSTLEGRAIDVKELTSITQEHVRIITSLCITGSIPKFPSWTYNIRTISNNEVSIILQPKSKRFSYKFTEDGSTNFQINYQLKKDGNNWRLQNNGGDKKIKDKKNTFSNISELDAYLHKEAPQFFKELGGNIHIS